MKIAFINPPFLHRYSRESRSPAVNKSGTLYYPMLLCYAAGYAEKRGHHVQLKDYTAWGTSRETAMAQIKAFDPELILINTTTGSSINDYDFATSLKNELKKKCHFSFVGTHVSAVPEDAFLHCPTCDSVCRGEYELTASELALAIQNRRSLSEVNGLIYRDINGKTISNPARPFQENLDDFPPVSTVYEKFLNYRDYFYGHSRHPIVTIVAGRGCPHRCVYCVYPQTFVGHKYRKRSISAVVNEMEYIRDHFPGVREIMFEDDTLSLDHANTRALCQEILRRKLRMHWSANSRADVDAETLGWMKKAGCRLLCVGFESGDQSMLDRMRKKIKIEQICEFVANARHAGILIHGCFMVGNPGETRETLQKTLDFAKQISPDTAQFFPIMIYPGTEAYEWASSNGYITARNFSEWITPEGLHNSVVSTPNLSARDLVEWCDRARREFYTRPRYWLYKAGQVLTHPGEFKRNLMGFRKVVRYLFRGTFQQKSCSCQN